MIHDTLQKMEQWHCVCGKKFKHRPNLYRHQKNDCPLKKRTIVTEPAEPNFPAIEIATKKTQQKILFQVGFVIIVIIVCFLFCNPFLGCNCILGIFYLF
jgi:hypothetical protein